jgi:hypothetical protein
MCEQCGLVFLAFAVSYAWGQTSKPSGGMIPTGGQSALILGRADQRLTPIAAETMRGMRLALERLGRPRCARAVGGQYAPFAKTRAVTTEYFALPASMVSAHQEPAGNFQVLYAMAYKAFRRILIFPAFMAPSQVLTKMRSGEVTKIDSLSLFESSMGFKPGSITEEGLEALMIWHEQSHLNDTALEDTDCFGASMLNTLRVAEACSPEVIDHKPSEIASRPICATCHPDKRRAS